MSLRDQPCIAYVGEPEGDGQWCNRCGWSQVEHDARTSTLIEAVLAAHRLVISDFLSVIARCATKECDWRWTGLRKDAAEAAHRAHVSAALAEAGIGDTVEIERGRRS